ncbi:MAG: hypothetical protein IJV85_02490 [Clostridia bacterium]|nr:hypothetical protein [Clostridia bacterium]
MKNWKKAVLAVSLAGACAFSACAGISSRAEEQTTSYITVNDFETQRSLNYLMMQNALGIVTLEKDAQYVTSGNASIKMFVQPDPFEGYYRSWKKEPYIFHATELRPEGLDYTDYTNVVAVEIDVFNAQDTVESIGFQHVYSTAYYSFTGLALEWVEVAPQAWTTVVLEINLAEMEIPEKFGSHIKGLGIQFERPAHDSEGKTFYMDHLRLKVVEPTEEESSEGTESAVESVIESA